MQNVSKNKYNDFNCIFIIMLFKDACMVIMKYFSNFRDVFRTFINRMLLITRKLVEFINLAKKKYILS